MSFMEPWVVVLQWPSVIFYILGLALWRHSFEHNAFQARACHRVGLSVPDNGVTLQPPEEGVRTLDFLFSGVGI